MNSYFHVDGQWVDQLVNNTFFLTNGYFQAKSIIADNECDKLRGLFESDIKSSKIRMLRPRSVLYEPHRFSCNGYVENALLDVHRHDVLPHKCFVEMVNDLLNRASLSQCLESILGSHSVLVHSMYFESSRGTIPHFDKFFMGVENNNMVGVWVALEDIDPSSGRFFIYTDSHNLNFEGSDNQDELVELLEEYKRLNTVAIHGHQKTSRKHHVRTIIDSKKVLNEIIDLAGWKKKYFSMQKGDVLFFSSSILHGSDAPEKIHTSRNSLIAHFVGGRPSQIRYGGVVESMDVVRQQGLSVHASKRYDYQDRDLKGGV